MNCNVALSVVTVRSNLNFEHTTRVLAYESDVVWYSDVLRVPVSYSVLQIFSWIGLTKTKMFYDVDILNRRGGKFGVIWMVANGKIKITKKGAITRKDLRLILSVDVGRIWYLKINVFCLFNFSSIFSFHV